MIAFGVAPPLTGGAQLWLAPSVATVGALGGPATLSTGLATGVARRPSSPRGTGRLGGRGDGWVLLEGLSSGGGKLGTGGSRRTALIFFPGGGPLGLGGICRPRTTRMGVAQEMSLMRRPVGRSTHQFLPQFQGHTACLRCQPWYHTLCCLMGMPHLRTRLSLLHATGQQHRCSKANFRCSTRSFSPTSHGPTVHIHLVPGAFTTQTCFARLTT